MLLALKTQNAIGAFYQHLCSDTLQLTLLQQQGLSVFFFLEKAGRFCSTKHQELEPSFRLSEQQMNPEVNQSPVQQLLLIAKRQLAGMELIILIMKKPRSGLRVFSAENKWKFFQYKSQICNISLRYTNFLSTHWGAILFQIN